MTANPSAPTETPAEDLSSTTVEPRTDLALDFLERWCPGGPWVLTAIRPDRKAIETRTFRDRKEAGRWLEGHNGERNLYFHVNPVMRDLTKKAERADIAALRWLHVDIDPRVGEDPDAERIRALGLLQNPPGDVPPPTVAIFSGGGYQGFWRLDRDYIIGGDLDRAEEAKRYNLQLEVLFGADHCHNVDRIMRLPGTVNLPDAKKARKGRVPTLAELVWFEAERAYPLSQFTAAAVAPSEAFGSASPVAINPSRVRRLGDIDELGEWGVNDRVKVLCVQGHLRDTEGPKAGDDSRSAWLMDAVCQLVRAGVPDEIIYSVITDPDFAISASVLDKGSLTERYARKQIAKAKELALDPRLAELNEQFAVVGNIGGKCRIAEEVEDQLGSGRTRTRLTLQSFADFRNRFMNELAEAGVDARGNPRHVQRGEWWLRHPRRRQYERIVFDPSREEVAGAYNLWRGFAYDARPGALHESFLDHVRENLCGGVEEYYHYLIRWMARAVQEPASPGEVAVILRSGQGTGKGFFARNFGRLFGRHYMQVSDSKFLVGSFNQHLRDCVVLLADEAFFAGDRKHKSVLKSLVTEELAVYERKGVDAEVGPNFVHLIMASNEDWVVPAEIDDRRFFVLDVSEARKQDRAYFGGIEKELMAGGYSHLLHHLMQLDVSDFQVEARPETTALRDQKLETMEQMSPVHSILLDWLNGDPMPVGKAEGDRWVVGVSALCGHIFQEYGIRLSAHRIGATLRETLRLRREHPDHRKGPGGREWLLPPREEARERWRRHMGGLGLEDLPQEAPSQERIPF